MALDFTTASLDSRVTVTRALNTATRVNSSGYIETVNADLPRFDFSPVTVGLCQGLLIEESRANALSYSNAFTTAPWQTLNTVSAAQNVTGPDGVANSAWTLSDNDAVNTGSYYRAVIVANDSTTYTASWFIKKTTGAATFPAVILNILGGATGVLGTYVINTNTGVATSSGASVTTSCVVRDFGQFWRVSITAPNNSTGNTVLYHQLSPAVNTNGGSTIVPSTTGSAVFYGVQLETGAFATSYIPTTTTSLTRNADAVSMTGTNFSSWYNATEGTFVVTGNIPFFGSGVRRFLSANDGTVNNSLQLAMGGGGTSGYFEARVSGSPVVSASVGTVATNSFYSYSMGYKLDSYAFAANASSPGTDPTATVPTVTQLSIGYHTTSVWINGYISKISYFPQRLINAEIQAQSK
jgi:hypothetical protein